MLPLSDGLHPRRFPFVNVALIATNLAVWILYEIPHLKSAVHHASFYPCAVDGSCHAPEPWGISWFTAMFLFTVAITAKAADGRVVTGKRTYHTCTRKHSSPGPKL